MVADVAVPILRVGEVAFAAMHDGVPEAAFGRIDSLADVVGLVQKIVEQPYTGDAAGGHVGNGRLPLAATGSCVFEGGGRGKFLEGWADVDVRLAGVERAASIAGQQGQQNWTVVGRVECVHLEGGDGNNQIGVPRTNLTRREGTVTMPQWRRPEVRFCNFR